MTGFRQAATALLAAGLATVASPNAQDRATLFDRQVDSLVEAPPEEQWKAVERGLWQQELDVPLALLDRLGPASGAWAPALRTMLAEEHSTTWWPALELLARVDAWAAEPSDAALFTVDEDRVERLAQHARTYGRRVVSPSGARSRVEFAALIRNSRRSIAADLTSAELGHWLAARPSDPFAVQFVAQTLAARGPAAQDALDGLLQALDGTLEETRLARGLTTSQIRSTVRSVARAVRILAPDDPRAAPAWLWTLGDSDAPEDDVLAAKAALLAHPPQPARATAALVRCTRGGSRECQKLAAIEVLVSLGRDALPAVSELQDLAGSWDADAPVPVAAAQAVKSILEAACVSWLGPAPSPRERTRSLRIRQQVDELLDAFLVAEDATEGEELFERLAGFGVFTGQALVDRTFRGGGAPAAISRGTPAGRLLAPLIARLSTAHAAVLPRIEAEIRRNDPLTQLWALDLYMRLGPWSGRVTPKSVPPIEAFDLRAAQLAWEGPEIDRRTLAQRVEQQRAYVESFLGVTRQRFAIRVDGPVHGLMELLRSRSPMEVELGARALALAERQAATAAVPLIRELRTGPFSRYEPVDQLDQNFWIHADTALDELWIQLAPPTMEHALLVSRSLTRQDGHPLEVARICTWLGAAPRRTDNEAETAQTLLLRILHHGCQFREEETLRPALAALTARLEHEPLLEKVREQLERDLAADWVPDFAIPIVSEILKRRH